MMIKYSRRLLVGLLAMLLVGVFVFGLDVQERRRFRDSLGATVTNQIGDIRVRLEAEINATFYLTRGLMAYVSLHPELEHDTFEHLVEDLFQYRSSIRGIALAPGNVISYIYPLAGNEEAVGLQYESNPEQWQAVKRAIDSRSSVMAGPVNLVQGGTAFISRTPIYLSPRGTPVAEHTYWGLASVVIDEAELFDGAGFNAPDLQIRFVIRGADGLGSSGALIHGDESIFMESPILTEVTVPGGSWQLAAVPLHGWNTPSPFLWWLRVGGFFLAIFTAWGVIYWQKRQDDSRLRLEEVLKQAELANNSLMKSEAFLNAIIENIPHMIFIKDADDLQFVRINKAGEELLGYSREELIGKSDYDFFPREEADAFVKMDREVLEKSGTYGVREDMIHTRAKGVRILHTKKISLLGKHDKPAFLMGISEDITGRNEAEEVREKLEGQLRQSLKMESIGTLAGGIAHDFNNILAAILGYAEMAMTRLPDDSVARDDLTHIMKAGNRARELVRHILSYSRKASLAASPVDVAEEVKDTLGLLRATIPTSITFEQDITPCGLIHADPTQIHQIVMNLCTNSSQAMVDGGGVLKVSLSLANLQPGDIEDQPTLKPGNYAHLRVEDTGIGISEHDLERIFDPYFTTKVVGKGSGMGLAVVMGIVKSHDGIIRVASEPGQGTVVDLYFPIIEGSVNALDEQMTPLPTGTENILVIDDEPTLATVTKLRLEHLGYRVKAFTSSVKAFEFFCSDPTAVDVVITDQAMPEMTGEVLARKMLAIRPDLPIVLCTGYSLRMDGEAARQMGIKGFIMKPAERAELANTLRRVLDGRGLTG